MWVQSSFLVIGRLLIVCWDLKAISSQSAAVTTQWIVWHNFNVLDFSCSYAYPSNQYVGFCEIYQIWLFVWFAYSSLDIVIATLLGSKFYYCFRYCVKYTTLTKSHCLYYSLSGTPDHSEAIVMRVGVSL